MKAFARNLWLAIFIAALFPSAIRAENNICPRPPPGSVVSNPPDLYSRNGVLRVNLFYNTETAATGRTLFCFTTAEGRESPTLHVHPGDRLIINLKNNLPNPTGVVPMRMPETTIGVCGDAFMTTRSVNLHFHGTNLMPVCHSDEVIHTLVSAGASFKYDFKIPGDQPPGAPGCPGWPSPGCPPKPWPGG